MVPVRPLLLQPGDWVALVAPSGYIAQEADLQVFFAWANQHKLQVWRGPHILERWGSLAGTDAQRLADLQTALDHPQVRAIFCTRGGYGFSRLLDDLSWDGFLASPKWMVGYSDITAGLAHIARLGFVSLHAEVARGFKKGGETLRQLEQALFRGTLNYPQLSVVRGENGPYRGRLYGGNLTLWNHLLATPSQPTLQPGDWLFLEDIGEALYHIDRLFLQLRRSGHLAQLGGLILGHFTDIKDPIPGFPHTLSQIARHHTQGYGYPILHLPSGHDTPNLPWFSAGDLEVQIAEGRGELWQGPAKV